MRGKHLNGVSFPLKLPLTLPNNIVVVVELFSFFDKFTVFFSVMLL
jgi:hypothetical protein